MLLYPDYTVIIKNGRMIIVQVKTEVRINQSWTFLDFI